MDHQPPYFCIMPVYVDQIGQTINLEQTPRRIISLVPSQTEYLIDLGLEEQIVGITKFCVHPEHLRQQKTIVGGTKNLHHDRIAALAPDLIIANKEENTADDIHRLQREYAVWTSDIITLEDSYAMMQIVADMTGTSQLGSSWIESIRSSFAHIPQTPKRKALYFIWNKPWMVAGTATFIHQLMRCAGFENAAAQFADQRYPEVTEKDILESDATHLLLSSEPFPFGKEHQAEIQALFPTKKVILVDGEMFSWYGSRMALAAKNFEQLQSIDFQ